MPAGFIGVNLFRRYRPSFMAGDFRLWPDGFVILAQPALAFGKRNARRSKARPAEWLGVLAMAD